MPTSTGLTATPLASFLGLAVLLALVTPVHAADQTADPAAERRSKFNFSLLPKSFQRKPSLDIHIVTELTSEGKKLAPPTSAAPVYYIAQPGRFTQMGDNTPAGEHPPDIERLTHAMESALASSGYVQATPATPIPALAVVFNYGSFARFSMTFHDMEEDMMLTELGMTGGPMLRSEDRSTDALLKVVLSHRNERDEVLKRASLIGGEKFSRDFAKALNDEATYRTGGDALAGLGSMTRAGPFNFFVKSNEELALLVEDSFNGCYFVIASAYDYPAMRRGQRVLLWRTKMTVNSSGISMAESLAPLVIAAGPYLGKEMPNAVTLTRKIFRGGSVKLHELKVIDPDVQLPEATPPAEKPPKR